MRIQEGILPFQILVQFMPFGSMLPDPLIVFAILPFYHQYKHPKSINSCYCLVPQKTKNKMLMDHSPQVISRPLEIIEELAFSFVQILKE